MYPADIQIHATTVFIIVAILFGVCCLVWLFHHR